MKAIRIELVENHENRGKDGVFEHFSLRLDSLKSAQKVSFAGVMTPGCFRMFPADSSSPTFFLDEP
jgi:hypothetical protein